MKYYCYKSNNKLYQRSQTSTVREISKRDTYTGTKWKKKIQLQKGWLRYIITLCGRSSIATLYWITVPHCKYVRNIIEGRKVKCAFLYLPSCEIQYNVLWCVCLLLANLSTANWKRYALCNSHVLYKNRLYFLLRTILQPWIPTMKIHFLVNWKV